MKNEEYLRGGGVTTEWRILFIFSLPSPQNNIFIFEQNEKKKYNATYTLKIWIKLKL